MKHERFDLTADGRVYLTSYIHDISPQKPSEVEAWRWELRPRDAWQIEKRPAVIIFPGGGYAMLSDREAEPVALAFLREGFNAFVCYYSLGEHSAFPGPLEDAAKAVWLVRSHAEEWGIDPNAIAVMGFSAGAHVAGLISAEWNYGGLEERLGIPAGGARPNAGVIGYGPCCITRGERAGAFEAGAMITGQPPEFEYHKYLGEHVPPLFIWHTWHDPLVPSSHALALADALSEKGLPYELHIFARGTHGMALCDDLTDYEAPIEVRPKNAALWPQMAAQWMKELFGLAL